MIISYKLNLTTKLQKNLQKQKLLLLLQSVPYYKDTRHIAQLPKKSPPRRKASKMHIDGATPIGRRLFHIICRFVVNLLGVWREPALFYLRWLCGVKLLSY